MINRIIAYLSGFMVLAVVIIDAGCTCDFEFEYRGKVVNTLDRKPIQNVKVITLNYDIYAINPDENNDYWPGEVKYTDSLGAYIISSWGLYDCGIGSKEINNPGDLGIIYFYFAKEGFIPVDTGFMGNTLKRNGRFYIIPEISLVSSGN